MQKIAIVNFELNKRAIYVLKSFIKLLEHRVKILSFVVQAHPDKNSINATFFFLIDSNLKPEDLLVELKKQFQIKNLKIQSMLVTRRQQRSIFFTLNDLYYLLGALRSLGEGGSTILYYMGVKAGKSLAEKMQASSKEEEKELENMLLYNQNLGHGIFSIETYINKTYCRIKAQELLECAGVKSSRPNSQLFRGMLAGFLSKLWNREAIVREIMCIAMGDPYCEFEVK